MKKAIMPNLSDRKGSDPLFLGAKHPVKLPHHPEIDKNNLLNYQHFSVMMNPARKMPWFTIVNINGSKLVDFKRSDGAGLWSFDPRISKEWQCGNEIYQGNKLDKGHMVRRLDPVWGTKETAELANTDTFYYTNATPQHADLNRIEWNNLEDWILKNANIHDLKISVLTGPVLKKTDKPYRNIQIPDEFWKIVVLVKSGTKQLSATGYLLSQQDMLSDLEGFVFGAYKTYQLPIQELEKRTGLDFGNLPDFDPKTLFESAQPVKVVQGWGDLVI